MIKGIQKFEGSTFEDNRGVIHEIFKDFLVKSVTHTTARKNSLRGIHVQDWNKIVYLAKGKILVGFYDPKTKQKVQIPMLKGEAYFIPKGIGNSYLALEDSEYFYFNTDNYDESRTYTISYKIFDWGIRNPIVSQKDENCRRTA